VITGSEDIDATLEKLLSGFRGQSFPASGILSVSDNQIKLQITTQAWHQVTDGSSARPADDVTD
jgi:hypothetical protein